MKPESTPDELLPLDLEGTRITGFANLQGACKAAMARIKTAP
jgi:hypothetical protein